MKTNGSRRPGWPRRLSVTAFTATALVVVLAALAWACTQRVGTMLVCQPASKRFVDSSQCGRVTGTTQTGAPSFAQAGGQIFSVKATRFQSTVYNVTFLEPNSTASCHRDQSATDDIELLAATNGATQFLGPRFYARFSTDQIADRMAEGGLGVAKICAQDHPDVIVGQVISLAVV